MKEELEKRCNEVTESLTQSLKDLKKEKVDKKKEELETLANDFLGAKK